MEDSLVRVLGLKMLQGVRVVHERVVGVGSQDLPVVVVVSRDLKEVADVEVVTKSDRKGFAGLVVDPVEGRLAAEGIREVLATMGIHSLVVLKVHHASGWAQQMNDGYQQESRSGQWLVPEGHNSEADHRQVLYLEEVASKGLRAVQVVVSVAVGAARPLVEP